MDSLLLAYPIDFLYTPLILEREIRPTFDEIHDLSFNAIMILVLLFDVALGIIGILLILIRLWAI